MAEDSTTSILRPRTQMRCDQSLRLDREYTPDYLQAMSDC